VSNAVAAAQRDRAPLLMTEFGATTDVATLRRLTAGFDQGLVPWLFWAYNEELVVDRDRPASLAAVRSLEALRALVRPYPTALAGTPELLSFDPADRTLELRYATSSPGGRRHRRSLETVVAMPRLAYPDGYTVRASGAWVSSAPCARRLTLRTRRGAAQVTVSVSPGGRCARQDPG
jgi:endoglycosylceramidase